MDYKIASEYRDVALRPEHLAAARRSAETVLDLLQEPLYLNGVRLSKTTYRRLFAVRDGTTGGTTVALAFSKSPFLSGYDYSLSLQFSKRSR